MTCNNWRVSTLFPASLRALCSCLFPMAQEFLCLKTFLAHRFYCRKQLQGRCSWFWAMGALETCIFFTGDWERSQFVGVLKYYLKGVWPSQGSGNRKSWHDFYVFSPGTRLLPRQGFRHICGSTLNAELQMPPVSKQAFVAKRPYRIAARLLRAGQ